MNGLQLSATKGTKGTSTKSTPTQSLGQRRRTSPVRVMEATKGDSSAAEVAHFVEGEFKGRGHVLARHVAEGKDELADGMKFQRAFFEQVVADAFVAGQQDPAQGTHQGQPDFIESSGREVG